MTEEINARLAKAADEGRKKNDCSHPKCLPAFDKELAKNMSSGMVKRLWPRFEGNCPDCGSQLIAYASFEHYISGDW